MRPEEIIANSIAVMIVSGSISLAINKVRENIKWGLLPHVAISAVLTSTVYLVLVAVYLQYARPSLTWRENFYPETVAVEGHWLERKEFNQGMLDYANSLSEGDISTYPYALLSIRYDKNEYGDFIVEGITASEEKFIRFRSDRVWTKLDDQKFLFTYGADVGDSVVSGLTEIVFYDEPDYKYKKGTGKFVDDRGFRVNFTLEKLDANNLSFDLNDPDMRVEYLRSLMNNN